MTPWLGFELRVALRFLREGRMQTPLIIGGGGWRGGHCLHFGAGSAARRATRSTRHWRAGASSACDHRTTWSPRPPRPNPAPPDSRKPSRAPSACGHCINWQALGRCSNGCRPSRPWVAHGGWRWPGPLRGEATQAISLWAWNRTATTASSVCVARWSAGSAPLAPGEAILGATSRPIWACGGRPPTVQTGAVNDAVRVTALVDLGDELNRRTVIVPLRAAQNLLACPAAPPTST